MSEKTKAIEKRMDKEEEHRSDNITLDTAGGFE
jgi:hypothetical protein